MNFQIKQHAFIIFILLSGCLGAHDSTKQDNTINQPPAEISVSLNNAEGLEIVLKNLSQHPICLREFGGQVAFLTELHDGPRKLFLVNGFSDGPLFGNPGATRTSYRSLAAGDTLHHTQPRFQYDAVVWIKRNNEFARSFHHEDRVLATVSTLLYDCSLPQAERQMAPLADIMSTPIRVSEDMFLK